MYRAKEVFDPDDITKEDMKKVSDHIESYLDLLEGVMIIPDEIKDRCEDRMKESIRETEKLIKKLRKGDKSVFKDRDEWNVVS